MQLTEPGRNTATRNREVSPGTIVQGWALLSYENRPIGLFGKGDYLTRDLFRPPMKITPMGQLVVENGEALSSGPDHAEMLRCLGRHASRLSESALCRTADFFTELAEKIDWEGEDALEVDLPLSQSQLAALLGMSVVHMNRTMMQLKGSKIVDYKKGILTILDRERLAELCAAIHS